MDATVINSPIVRNSIPVDEAKQIKCEAPTPEAAKVALMEAFEELINELQKDELYCGMAIEVHRVDSADGKIACIQLFPCDDVGGNPARRI